MPPRSASRGAPAKSAGQARSSKTRRLQGKTSGQISRLLKRLRVHGLIKKIGKTYKYYLASFGKQIPTLGLKLKELHIAPQLSTAAAA